MALPPDDISSTTQALRDNWGSLGTAIAFVVAAFYAFWKVLPNLSSRLDSGTSANNIQTNLISTLRQERDTAIERLEMVMDKLMEAKAQIINLQRELNDAEMLISRLRLHVDRATQQLDSAPAPIPGDDHAG